MSQLAYFSELPINTFFSYNGNPCKKRSSKTADLVNYDQWFYFGKNDLCIVGVHSRLDKDYFKA
jgi:hypothetical protein